MTIRAMYRMTALLLILPFIAACGTAEALDPAAAKKLEQAQQSADRAEKAVAVLQTRVAELEGELRAAGNSAAGARKRLAQVSERLWSSLKKARTAAGEVRSTASGAAGSAASALATALQAAKELTVLKDRFDYHLVHDHGGG